MKNHKLDIFDVLAATDTRDFGFLERQPEEARKGFAAPVVLRWASAINNGMNADLTLLLINETANLHFYDLSDHPDLQFKLIASCGLGQKTRHHWIPMPKGKRKTTKLHEFLYGFWPNANDMEIEVILKQFTRETFQDFASGAVEPAEVKVLMDAYDRHHGIEPVKKGKAKGRAKG